jgi:8-oxo-dGTP pyrophosphatase MutT (NUDIX family)
MFAQPSLDDQAPLVLRLRRAAYRVAYRVLQLAAIVRAPRGQGAKALLVCDGELLLVLHTYGPNRWELPGGGVRRREQPLAALMRELNEELGVNAPAATALAVVDGPGRRSRHRTHLYRVDVSSKVLRPDPVEIAEVRWCDAAALPPALGSMVAQALALSGLARAAER